MKKFYSGNVSEKEFWGKADCCDPVRNCDGICTVVAGACGSWNRSLYQHESCYFGKNWNGNRKLAGTAQYDHICLCHFAWQGKYRIWNTCQYVFSWIFTAVFSWVWDKILPAGLFDSMAVRILVLIPALAIFVVSAAVYMDVKLGTAPYDAIAFIIAKWMPKVPFRLIRMAFDFTVIVIAFLFGGKIGIVTILMGFTLGPVIGAVGEKIGRFIECD